MSNYADPHDQDPPKVNQSAKEMLRDLRSVKVTHRHFPKSFSTFCGLDARNHETTGDDRKTTCRRCLKSMAAYELRRLDWKEAATP